MLRISERMRWMSVSNKIQPVPKNNLDRICNAHQYYGLNLHLRNMKGWFCFDFNPLIFESNHESIHVSQLFDSWCAKACAKVDMYSRMRVVEEIIQAKLAHSIPWETTWSKLASASWDIQLQLTRHTIENRRPYTHFYARIRFFFLCNLFVGYANFHLQQTPILSHCLLFVFVPNTISSSDGQQLASHLCI